MIEYEKLTVPGRQGDPRHTVVDAHVKFRFVGRHPASAAVAEAESRLALLPGIDIDRLEAWRPISDLAEGILVVDPSPNPWQAEAEYQSRVACALDLAANPTGAGLAELVDLMVRALTRTQDGYRTWLALHPGWLERLTGQEEPDAS